MGNKHASAQYTKTLDNMLLCVADYKESEADNLIYSQQMCFDVEARAQFRAAYLRYRDVLIPLAKKEYEELHDQFMTSLEGLGLKARSD